MPSEDEAGEEVQALLADATDFEYETEISRAPFRLKNWVRYLAAKTSTNRRARNILHERALKFLPTSYKLWHQYLTERLSAVEGKCITDPACQIVVNTFERALHDRIWPLYLEWAKGIGVKETAIRVYRRYLMYDPLHREQYVEYLEGKGEWEEAAHQLAICVNDESFISPEGHTRHQVDAIIRSGLTRFTDEVGRLWCKLADYYIRLGQFERARDVYEEGITTVITVRDFTMVFDAYSQFEESVLSAKMQLAEDGDSDGEDAAGTDSDTDLDDDADDVDLRLARLEHLLERRPLLISSVLLRQNPHNVHEWQKRVKLFVTAGKPADAVRTYADAVKAISPKLAVGKLCNLWIEFAKFYEEHGDMSNARTVFEKALLPTYRNVDDLASVWCAYADFELRHDCFTEALKVMQRATTGKRGWPPEAAVERRRLTGGHTAASAQKAMAESPVQDRVYKSTKVWSTYLDLEESLGTPETTRAAYDRAMELRVATPGMVLNYATFLEEHRYFEESFAVYEKGVGLFAFPYVK
ncbi:hypothetical protein JKP88DRAFT_202283, partial [Tribonema minus]